MITKTKQKNNINLPVFLVMFEVECFWQKGDNFVKSCLQLNDDNDLESKIVLSTLAVEILVKSVIGAKICMQNIKCSEDCIKKKIEKKNKSIGHDFEKLFNNAKDLKKEMNIECIKRVNHTEVIDEYRLKLFNESTPLIFKTLEASRYGPFSTNKDVFVFANRDREDEFLDKLSKVTSEKINFAFEYLKNVKIC